MPASSMFAASILAQENSIIPEAGGGAIIVWAGLAIGITALYLVIRKTQRRSYKSYMSRDEREDQLKANDPDMRHDDTD